MTVRCILRSVLSERGNTVKDEWESYVPEEMQLECERLYSALVQLRRKPDKTYQDKQLLRALGKEHHSIMLTAQRIVAKECQ